jgi:hypothetical protein
VRILEDDAVVAGSMEVEAKCTQLQRGDEGICSKVRVIEVSYSCGTLGVRMLLPDVQNFEAEGGE